MDSRLTGFEDHFDRHDKEPVSPKPLATSWPNYRPSTKLAFPREHHGRRGASGGLKESCVKEDQQCLCFPGEITRASSSGSDHCEDRGDPGQPSSPGHRCAQGGAGAADGVGRCGRGEDRRRLSHKRSWLPLLAKCFLDRCQQGSQDFIVEHAVIFADKDEVIVGKPALAGQLPAVLQRHHVVVREWRMMVPDLTVITEPCQFQAGATRTIGISPLWQFIATAPPRE